MVCFVAGIGIFSIHQTGQIGSTSRSNDNEIRAVVVLGSFKQLSQELRALAVLARVAPSEEAQRDSVDRTGRILHALSRAWTEYAPMVTTAEERNLAQRLWEAWQHVLAVAAEAAALDRAGERDLADTVLTMVLQADAETVARAADAVLTYRQTRASERRAGGDTAGLTVQLELALAMSVAALAALGFVRILRHRVIRPIAATTCALHHLADHELLGPIPGAGHGEALGSMAGTVEALKETLLHTRRLESEAVRLHAVEAQRREIVVREMTERFEATVGDIAGAVASAAEECAARPISSIEPSGLRRASRRWRPWPSRRPYPMSGGSPLLLGNSASRSTRLGVRPRAPSPWPAVPQRRRNRPPPASRPSAGRPIGSATWCG
ncbi:Tar ligand binding domain-containing protein [Methylobacterium phyllosphaerae]